MEQRFGMSSHQTAAVGRQSENRALSNTAGFDIVKGLLSLYIFTIFVFDNSIIYQAALLLLVGAIFLFDSNWLSIRFDEFFLCFGILFFYFVFHTYFGFSQAISASQIRLMGIFLTFISIGCVSYVVESRNCIDVVFDSIIYIAVFLAIHAVLVLGPNITNDFAWNSVPKPLLAGATFAHNDLPILFALATFFLRYKLLVKNLLSSFSKIAAWGLIAVFSILIILSGARKGLICLCFALVFFPILCVGKKRALVSKLLLISVIFLALYFLFTSIDFLYSSMGYRLEAVVNGLSGGDYSEGSSRYRNLIGQYAWSSILKNPFVGYGLNSFGVLSGFGGWTENGYLDLMYSGGILALAIYLFFYAKSIIVILSRKSLSVESCLFLSLSIWCLLNNAITVAYASRPLSIIGCLISAYLMNYLDCRIPIYGKEQNEIFNYCSGV